MEDRLIARFVCSLMTMICLAAAPATPAPPPASAPGSAPTEPLVDGAIRFTPPEGWKLIQKSDDNMSAQYASPDDATLVAITVSPQNAIPQASAREQMAKIIKKGITDAATAAKYELVFPVTIEKDERFFLKMRDAQRIEGKIADRVQIYRMIGSYLVHVACTTRVDSVEESAGAHETVAKMLYGMQASRGAKRSFFPRTQIRLIAPVDWKEARSDQPNGLVATYSDPKDPLNQVIVRARIVPKTMRENAVKRDALMERMVDEERHTPPLGSGSTQEEVIPGGTYLRQIRTSAMRGEKALQVITRYFVVGDVIVSVRSTAVEGDEEAVAKIGDKLAETVKPIRE